MSARGVHTEEAYSPGPDVQLVRNVWTASESEAEEGADRGRTGGLSAVLGRRRRRWVLDDNDSESEGGGGKGGRTETGGAGRPVRLGGGGKRGWVT